MRYSAQQEATKQLQMFGKAVVTIRTKYTKPGQADRIINRMIADKFGSDATLETLVADFQAGRYDLIVGRIRQADRVRAEQKAKAAQIMTQLLDEMNLLYCGQN